MGGSWRRETSALTEEGKEGFAFKKQPDSQIHSNLIMFLLQRVTLPLI